MSVDLIQGLRDFFESRPHGAIAAYVFGSVARGEARRDSDVDVGVLFEHRPPPSIAAGFLPLEGLLERALRRPVQVVALNDAPAALVHRVLRDGVLVLDRDRSRRIQFEVAKRSEFFDLEPIRRAYRAVGSTDPAR